MSNKTYKNRWWVLLSTGLMILLINIDGTIVNVALPQISVHLNASLTLIQWIVASYLLGTALFFTICGRLADMYGNKRIFLIGTTIFTFASLACGFAPNAITLICARFIQGIGFASTLGIAIILISNAFPPGQRGLANGMAVTLTGLGQIIGPSLGGVILTYASWSWIFLVNVPIGIVCFILTYLLAPKDDTHLESGQLDFTALILFIAGIAIITSTLNEVVHLEGSISLSLVAVGIACLIGYWYRSKHSANPLIATSLLTHKEFMKNAVVRVIFMLMWAIVLLFIPLYLQNIVGYSPLHAGLLILIMTGMIAIFSPITGQLVDRFGFKNFVILSMLLSAVACIMMSFFKNPPNESMMIIAFLLFGIGVGIHIPSTLNGVMRTSEKQHRSTGMGLFFTTALIGSITGIALSGSYMTEKSRTLTLHNLMQYGLSLHQTALNHIFMVASGAHDVQWMQHNVPTKLLPKLTHIAHYSFLQTFHQLMLINTVLCLIGAVIATRINMNNLVD